MNKREVLWFLVFFSCLVFFDAEAPQNPLGSTLSVAEHDHWTSPNGNFAFGFFSHSDQPNQFVLGIRFNSISIPLPEQAVVWVAGAHLLVGLDSFLELTEAGDLILFDSSRGAVVWSSNTRNSTVASASLRDDGNLVLLDSHQDIVWQSFAMPSDTLLPGQRLTSLQTLQPASSNSLSSYYSLLMDPSGQLRLRWKSNVVYWKTEVTSSEPILAAVFTREGAFQLLDAKSRPVWSMFGDDHRDYSVSFRFLRLDADGNLRMYSWDGASNSWRKTWQAVANQCDVFATRGFSSICALPPSGNATCEWPFGSGSNTNTTCWAPYNQRCNSVLTMITLEHTFLYGIYPPVDFITRSSIEQCRNSCLLDPQCTAVTLTNDDTDQCRIKKTQFIVGCQQPSLRSISFVKACCLDPRSPRGYYAPPPASSHKRSFAMSSVIALASGILAGFLILVLVFLYLSKRRKAVASSAAARYPCQNSSGLISLSYSALKDITFNFKHQLGLNLYKGVLPTEGPVVIKELKYNAECRKSIGKSQFKSWISVLGDIRHKNLAKLVGYCCNSHQRFLVYEFVKNASVDKWLKNATLSSSLTWRKRMNICVGVARALAHLHSGCRELVIHGNLKWKNIVLDEELEAKVIEFGLAKISASVNQNSQMTEVDVARFGEMIVAMVSGHQGGVDVCRWAYEKWLEGNAVMWVLDSRIKGKFDAEEVDRMLRIAF